MVKVLCKWLLGDIYHHPPIPFYSLAIDSCSSGGSSLAPEDCSSSAPYQYKILHPHSTNQPTSPSSSIFSVLSVCLPSCLSIHLTEMNRVKSRCQPLQSKEQRSIVVGTTSATNAPLSLPPRCVSIQEFITVAHHHPFHIFAVPSCRL